MVAYLSRETTSSVSAVLPPETAVVISILGGNSDKCSNLRLARELVGQSDAGKRFDPYEAAQTVFPTLIRPLQKYMRATRQQSRHPVDSVIDHLAMCLTYGLSPLS
ncbi:unnamed protein product, partial [Dibothriocephalus latus]